MINSLDMMVEELYDVKILEMARIACASIPEDLCEQMDLYDDYFVEIREYIQEKLPATYILCRREYIQEKLDE